MRQQRASGHGHGRAKASLTVLIPKRPHGGRHPATISPSTLSIVITVNGGSAIFNTSPNSPGCSSGKSGTVCTLQLQVPYGSDTFVVSTYSAKDGGGSMLDQASIDVTITTDTTQVAITLGPVFTNTNDDGPGSLRQAIADANPGDTIAFVGKTPATIKLSSGGLDLTQNIKIAGPGASNLSIAGDGTFELLLVEAGVKASITGLTMKNGGDTSGGAIGNEGTLTLDSDTFHNNGTVVTSSSVHNPASAPAKGPHVTVVRHGHHAPRVHSSRPQPPAGHKHAPHKLTRAVLRPHGPPPVFTGLGGAVYSDTGATLTVTNTAFTGNATGAGGAGGAIFAASGSTLSVSGSNFLNNEAEDGGALYTEAASATITNNAFTNNNGVPGDPSGQGGAIFSGAAVTIDSCTFTGNVAGDAGAAAGAEGGAIYQDVGSLLATNDTFTSNVAGNGTGGSYGYGGAIYYGAPGVTATLNNDDFESNTSGGDAYGYGGAVYAEGAVTGAGDTFANNIVLGTAGEAYGGGLYAERTSTIATSTFTSNTVTGTGTSGIAAGGGLYSTGTATLTTVTFSQNTVTGGPSGALGGGADLEDANNTLSAVTFTGNTATASGSKAFAEGGGAAINGTATVTGAAFGSNTATTLAGNAGYGGGLYISDPASFTGTVTNNTAAEEGGGIDVEDIVTISNSTIAGNTVTAATISGDGGGGIYDNATLTLTTSAVTGNTVVGSNSDGGGIFGNGDLTIANSTISNNSVTDLGGGIDNVAGLGVSFTNVTVFANTAAGGSGGNIANSGSGADLAIANSIVAGGSAKGGADILNDGEIDTGDYNIVQTPVSGNPFTGNAVNDQFGVDPLLLPLANNGGPTQTNADQLTSPGTGYIPLGVCTAAGITTDQRGLPRGNSGHNTCDAGAYELQ